MPVEHQDEQEANTEKMKALLGDAIIPATGPELLAKFDQLVRQRTLDTDLSGDMGRLVRAVDEPRTNTGHIAELIAGRASMKPEDKRLLDLSVTLGRSADTKAMRRLTKVIYPVLAAIKGGSESFVLKPTRKERTTTINGLDDMLALLQNKARLESTMKMDSTGPEAQQFLQECIQTVKELKNEPAASRAQLAQRKLDALGQRFVLGY